MGFVLSGSDAAWRELCPAPPRVLDGALLAMGEKELLMRSTLRVALAASVVVLALAGCAQAETGTSPGAGITESASPPATDTPAEVVLSTGQSSLGTIVVDDAGMTVYVFDKDTPDSGTSACEGDCLAKWPAVTTESDDPEVNGITGTVDTITRSDGSLQLTLNGWPLYLFADDAASGDVTGHGVGGVWWAVGSDGEKITTPAGG